MCKKTISGGQTGADRAGLDFALKFYMPHGGWIPKGRITEKGPLPDKYQLQEMLTYSYLEETRNIYSESGGMWTDSLTRLGMKHKLGNIMHLYGYA